MESRKGIRSRSKGFSHILVICMPGNPLFLLWRVKDKCDLRLKVAGIESMGLSVKAEPEPIQRFFLENRMSHPLASPPISVPFFCFMVFSIKLGSRIRSGTSSVWSFMFSVSFLK